MHNLPTNNETNIIRNIFNESARIENARQQSLNESPVSAAAKAAEKAAAKAAEKAAAKAAKAAEKAAAIAKAETVPMAPAPGLGEAGAQPRTINTGENITVNNEVRNVVRDPSTGQVTETQPAPTGEPVRTKRDPTPAQIDGANKAAKTRSERDPTEKELNWREGGGTDPVTGERITPTDRSTKNAILKYGAGTAGVVIAGGSIAAPFMVGGKEREYSTIEDRPVTPKPAPSPAPAPTSAPSDASFTLPSGGVKSTTNPYDIPSAKGPNKNLGGLAASYGLGTTDDVRTRTQNVVDQLSKTFNDIVNAPSKPAAPAKLPEQPMDRAVAEFRNKPAAPAKLPEQPMDRAVRQFRNREEEEKIARSTLSEPTTPSITPVTPKPSPMYPPEGQTRPSVPQPTTKGAYESGQQVSEAEWKARADKAQAAYNDTRAKKAGYRDYAHYQQMQDESQSLQTTISAQQSRLAELDKSNDAKIAALKAQAAATKKAGDEIDPVGAAMRRNINRAAGRPEDEDLPADMQARITNRTESGGVTSEPITDFSPEAQRRRTAARDQARFGTYQGVPKRDTGYGTMKPISEVYYRRLANLFEETRDSLEDVSAKRRERQVKVAGLEGQVNPHGFMDLVKGIRNVQAFSGMGGGGMPKERVEKQSENVGKRTVGKADQRKALMAIMSASQDHADLKDRFTKEDALNPHSPLHKMLVSRNPDLRDESKVMAKYYTGS